MNYEEVGLIEKYKVTRTDGKDNFGEEYFVLRLDEGTELKHRIACLNAISTYCDSIERHLPELAKDLREKYFNA